MADLHTTFDIFEEREKVQIKREDFCTETNSMQSEISKLKDQMHDLDSKFNRKLEILQNFETVESSETKINDIHDTLHEFQQELEEVRAALGEFSNQELDFDWSKLGVRHQVPMKVHRLSIKFKFTVSGQD